MAWWSPVRPGEVIKEVLEEQGSASISDLHREYRDRTNRENQLRPKGKRLKGMTYSSFRTFVRRAKLAGLVEPIGEAPLLWPPRGTEPQNPLLGIRDQEVVPATRRLYALTAEGRAETEGWRSLYAYYGK